ncbi:hypothetical protein RHSIM_Rhsim06G0074600 [Rhododendron simsii]|uniref:Uncharacterized protein n=1 Tax=Rhododendron simsii TaxID=118357 RepID=A0A834GXI5_RHOSS|nr:hypothetical protein RHSIM_Rhsim06G0074600 [Rhododendron simsii]
MSTRRSEDNPDEPSEAFVPDFTCSDGHVIAADDSLEESPLLAMTLLKGLALPKDMENLQTGKANNMAELCLFLAKAGQCAGKAFADMHALLDTKRSMRVDLQAKRKEADQLADRLEELEAQVAESESVRQERDRLLLQLKDAEEENIQLKKEKQQAEEELPKKLEEAGDAGYNEAGEYYQEQVQNLVTKAFREGELKGMKDTHHSSFLRGTRSALIMPKFPREITEGSLQWCPLWNCRRRCPTKKCRVRPPTRSRTSLMWPTTRHYCIALHASVHVLHFMPMNLSMPTTPSLPYPPPSSAASYNRVGSAEARDLPEMYRPTAVVLGADGSKTGQCVGMRI